MTLQRVLRAVRSVALLPLLFATAAGLGAQAPKPQGAAAPKPATRPAPAQRKPAPARPAAPRPNSATVKESAPPPAPKPVPTALKMRTRHTANAQISENTTYFGTSRQRYQFPGLATVLQCDLSRTLQVNDRAKRYLVQSNRADESAPEVAAGSAEAAPAGKAKSGVITYTVTTSDTGERKEVLGRSAAHLVVTTRKRPSPEACDKSSETITVDGWFIDLPSGTAACTSSPMNRPTVQPAASECTDKIETAVVGGITPGFALESTTTIVMGDDQKEKDGDKGKAETVARSVMHIEVLELQQEPVTEALFDVPRDYVEVKNYADLFASSEAGAAAPSASMVNDSLTAALLGSVADGTRQIAPKTPGSIRIGVGPVANPTGRDVSGMSMQAALVGSLHRAPYEAIPLMGSTSAELSQDARAKGADYVLTSALTTLKSSKPSKAGGMLKRMTGDAPADEIHDARVDLKLFTIDQLEKPALTGSGKANSGGGFGVGSAFKLAAFAGQMYVGMMTGGMMSMNGIPGLANLGAAGGGNGFSSIMMGPGMGMAMSVMSQAAESGGADGTPGFDAGSAAVEHTVQDAVGKAGDDLLDELKKKRPSR
jgi:hypothetical protein